ncbi:MAG: cbb3-type cytochrome c oxidase N-terminal domain-containing protein [Bacteroidota bacterium]
MKNKWIIGLVITAFFLLNAQTHIVAAPEDLSSPFFEGLFFKMFAAIASLTIIAAFYTFLRINNMLMHQAKKQLYKDQGLKMPEPKKAEGSPWDRFMERMTKSVPFEQEADVMLDHDYDGIKELDNSLPPWWVAMFYITIAFGVVYYSYYHLMKNGGKSIIESYEEEMAAGEEIQLRYLERMANKVNERSVVALTTQEELLKGKRIFDINCVSCHGTIGEGGIGPNMTDDYWIHGGDIKNIFRTIKYGVIEKGMTPWEKQIGPRQIQEVASYIMTLRGTNPPNGKAPQGDLWQYEQSKEETENEENIEENSGE